MKQFHFFNLNLYLFIVLFISSCSLTPKKQFQTLDEFQRDKNTRSISSYITNKPKHYIITIHGLSGDATTFGYMLPLLEYHIEKYNFEYDVVPLNFVYPTGTKSVNVEHFVKLLESYLTQQFTQNELQKEDKISIIAHSQGGLISTLWYLKSIYGEDPRFFFGLSGRF